MSAQYPAGALAADSILSAAGVLHSHPALVVLPGDSSLGEFREEFAGELGLFMERPEDEREVVAAFVGAEELLDTRELIDRMHNDPDQRADALSFLTARLIDVLLGDWDRHAGQWNWANFGQGEGRNRRLGGPVRKTRRL